MRILHLTFLCFLISLMVLSSCKKEEFETGNVDLTFSADTILFDTVFTTVGSATEVFTVYNSGDKDVKVSSIRLATGESSNFRLNVDGVAGKSFSDVIIGANDSIFIFVEVTVDPNNLTTPLIITDSILFNANNFQQDIDLVAWGQDAYFHRPAPNSQISPFFYLNCNEVWNSDKPHVIYGYAIVDSACTLTVNEGTNVYFHPGSLILALTSSTFLVNGTQQNKVTFQGDRLGEDYKDVPGQWDGIYLTNINRQFSDDYITPGTKNSSIKYAVIKNGNIGLTVDTVYDNNPTTVTLHLENTIIKNMATTALRLNGSRVNAFNSVFANCGAQTTRILFGGVYNFFHCTFANFWSNGQRNDPALTLNNYYNNVRSLNAYFGNCIIYGSNEEELDLDSFPSGNLFNYHFDHAILKVKNTFSTSNAARYTAVLKAYNSFNDPLFKDVDNNDYQLDSLSSPAINAGDINITNTNAILNSDILGNSRQLPPAPDLGAYERR